MQLRQIEVFHAVMLSGSISSAARHLRISQPAATRLLKRAEDQLGYKLFSREKSRLTPTYEATVLFAETQRVMSGFEHLQRLSLNLGRSRAGHLRVAATPSLCVDVVPLAVARLRRRNRHMTFTVEGRLYQELLRVVSTREVDIAFGLNLNPPAGMEVSTLTQGRFFGIFPAAEEAKLPKQVDAKIFARYPFINQLSDNPTWPFAAAGIDSARRRELNFRPVVGVKTNQVALALVQQGAGAAIVDQYTVATAEAKGVAVRPLSFDFTFSVDTIRLSGQPTSQLADQFVDAFVKAEREVSARLEGWRSEAGGERVPAKP